MNIADRESKIAEMSSYEHFAFSAGIMNDMKHQLLSNLSVIFGGQSLVKRTQPSTISTKICAFLHGMSLSKLATMKTRPTYG